MKSLTGASGLAIWAVLIILVGFALAGILLIQPGAESDKRLALFFGVLATAVGVVAAVLKADQAAQNTNGKLDARIEAAVHRANAARRRGDEPLTPEEIDRGNERVERYAGDGS